MRDIKADQGGSQNEDRRRGARDALGQRRSPSSPSNMLGRFFDGTVSEAAA